jgi:hypothetical protein
LNGVSDFRWLPRKASYRLINVNYSCRQKQLSLITRRSQRRRSGK